MKKNITQIEPAAEEYIEPDSTNKKNKIKKDRKSFKQYFSIRTNQNHFVMPICYFIGSFILEIVGFAFLGFTASNGEPQLLPDYSLFNLSIFIICTGILLLIKSLHAQRILGITLLSFNALLNMVNATIYKVFGDVLSMEMLKLGEEGFNAFSLEFLNYGSILANLAVLLTIIALTLILQKAFDKPHILEKSKRLAILLACFFVLEVGAVVGFSMQVTNLKTTDAKNQNYIAESDQFLWETLIFKHESYRKFGTFGYWIKSIYNIFKTDKLSDEEIAILKDYMGEDEQENLSAPSVGNNLIIIMLESFEPFAIDPYNTPTLYSLFYENDPNNKFTDYSQYCYNFENFHGRNKTNVSEAISLLGNMVMSTSLKDLNNDDRLVAKYSLPNLLKVRGYTTNYFHSYKKTFYDRDSVNLSLGFDNVYGLEDSSLPQIGFNNWNLDSDYIKDMAELFMPVQDEPFFSFFTTVTTHGTYTNDLDSLDIYENEFDTNYQDYYDWAMENTEYYIPKTNDKLYGDFRHYKAAAMDTNAMLEYILEYLETNNMLSNTDIILYSDHNAYYSDIGWEIKNIDKTKYYTTNAYNIPFLMYSQDATNNYGNSGIVDTFCNTYDIYATVADMYGLPVNKSIMQGYSIFSEEIKNSIFVSFLSGIFTDNLYSSNINNIIGECTKEEAEKFKNNAIAFYIKQTIIDKLYKNKII